MRALILICLLCSRPVSARLTLVDLFGIWDSVHQIKLIWNTRQLVFLCRDWKSVWVVWILQIFFSSWYSSNRFCRQMGGYCFPAQGYCRRCFLLYYQQGGYAIKNLSQGCYSCKFLRINVVSLPGTLMNSCLFRGIHCGKPYVPLSLFRFWYVLYIYSYEYWTIPSAT